jgi:hypothetical protein
MSYSSSDPKDADFTLYLDTEVEQQAGYFGDLIISERGLIFRSTWNFKLGTQLALRLCVPSVIPGENPICEELSGLVVNCEPVYGRSNHFEITVLFMNLSRLTQRRICGLAFRPELTGGLN